MTGGAEYPYYPCSLCYTEERDKHIKQIQSDKSVIKICRTCVSLVKGLDGPNRYGTDLTRKWSKLSDADRQAIYEELDDE